MCDYISNFKIMYREYNFVLKYPFFFCNCNKKKYDLVAPIIFYMNIYVFRKNKSYCRKFKNLPINDILEDIMILIITGINYYIKRYNI